MVKPLIFFAVAFRFFNDAQRAGKDGAHGCFDDVLEGAPHCDT